MSVRRFTVALDTGLNRVTKSASVVLASDYDALAASRDERSAQLIEAERRNVALAADLAKMTAAKDHLYEANVQYAAELDDLTEKSQVGREASLRKLRDLRAAIEEHNQAVLASCVSNATMRGCVDYTSRGRQCPDCPKDWLIDLTPEETPGVIPLNAQPEDPVPACGHAKAGRKRDGMGFEYCGYCGFTFDRASKR